MNHFQGEYVIEKKDPRVDKMWHPTGALIQGSQWRDERLVNDETMLEEVAGYRKTWPNHLAMVVKPDGTILAEKQAGLDKNISRLSEGNRKGFPLDPL